MKKYIYNINIIINDDIVDNLTYSTAKDAYYDIKLKYPQFINFSLPTFYKYIHHNNHPNLYFNLQNAPKISHNIHLKNYRLRKKLLVNNLINRIQLLESQFSQKPEGE